jgi:exodeoxyribonuclease-3
MIRTLALTVVLTICSTLLFAQSTLKVLTYNLTNGINTSKEELAAFQGWMKLIGTDVAAFQNVDGMENTDFTKIAKKWKHSYSTIMAEKGKTIGVTSKYPIKNVQIVAENCLSLEIEGITYVVIHVEADSVAVATIKEKANALSSKLVTMFNKDTKIVALGTIQGYAPLDSANYSKRFRLIPVEERAKKKTIQQVASYQRANSYDLVRLFTKQLSFVDVLGEMRDPKIDVVPTFPTKMGGETPIYNSYRYDYIFVTPILKANCKAVTILQDELTHRYSKHYPVLLELML